MEKRKLGRSDLEFLPLAFGGNVFGWTIDQPTSFELLDAFVDNGFTFVDTADVYSNWKPGNSGGESEIIIGNWLKRRGNRDQLLIATKVGSAMVRGGAKNLSKKYILKAVEDSLKRLQTDYIDLYQSHYDDLTRTVEEPLEAYAQLIKEGKVRFIGASNFSAERLQKALSASQRDGLPRYESLQPLYNLYDRADFETDLQALTVKEEVGVIPYYSLASGFLSGKYRTEADLGQSARGAGIQKYLNEKGFTLLKALDDVAEDYKTTPTQISIAWLLAQEGITAPIASATKISQLNELMEAIKIKLDEKSIAHLTNAIKKEA
ncbi:aldo/keto reductase [Solitalea sp. MAHUQ-68]|uniref:Aldo/keto reductase n=1 Tax=Solitalea agri TaxID=2953739 RepID=A0A9X2F068_9SPHI|nr:aldo/keto reductase [Solitalea agri]MCO4291705.1 aldo/keto reductase [Solitalea agri]